MKKKTLPPIAVCAFELDSSSPGRVQIFPAGRFDAPLGAVSGQGPWNLTAAAASALIGRVAARTTPIHFDYHHASLTAAQNGHKAPAAGWLETSNLVWEDGKGLFGANVQWTDRAVAEIAAREFRFLSPVFSYDPTSGAPLDLFSIALTNTPAIDGMSDLLAAASSAFSTFPESPMDDLFERLCYLLNLPLTTTVPEMAAQLDKLKAMLGQEAQTDTAAASAGLIGLLDAKNGKIAALQSKASDPDPSQYAPVAALSAVQQELAALQGKWQAREVDDLIKPALADGRLLPALEVWARGLGRSDLAALQTYLDSTKPIAALAGMQTGGKTPDAVDNAEPKPLNDEELAVCAQMGIDPERYAADKAKKGAKQ